MVFLFSRLVRFLLPKARRKLAERRRGPGTSRS